MQSMFLQLQIKYNVWYDKVGQKDQNLHAHIVFFVAVNRRSSACWKAYFLPKQKSTDWQSRGNNVTHPRNFNHVNPTITQNNPVAKLEAQGTFSNPEEKTTRATQLSNLNKHLWAHQQCRFLLKVKSKTKTSSGCNSASQALPKQRPCSKQIEIELDIMLSLRVAPFITAKLKRNC